MPLAMVVAAGVAVNDGAIEEHRQHLLHGKFGSASVDADIFDKDSLIIPVFATAWE